MKAFIWSIKAKYNKSNKIKTKNTFIDKWYLLNEEIHFACKLTLPTKYKMILLRNKSGLVLLCGFLVSLIVWRLFLNSNNKPTRLFNVHNDNATLLTKCDYGPKGPRILCAVFTYAQVHNTTLIPVHNTWAKRFDFRLYLKQWGSRQNVNDRYIVLPKKYNIS